MVEIKCSYSVSFEDSKWSLIPDSLITEFEGKKFLKMKATSAAIIALLLNGPVPKNARGTRLLAMHLGPKTFLVIVQS